MAKPLEMKISVTDIDKYKNILFMYDQSLKTLKSILDDGDFEVETFNESILVSYMEALGYKVDIKKSYRDIGEDFKQHCDEMNELNSIDL